jgi:hypothetical protein
MTPAWADRGADPPPSSTSDDAVRTPAGDPLDMAAQVVVTRVA